MSFGSDMAGGAAIREGLRILGLLLVAIVIGMFVGKLLNF